MPKQKTLAERRQEARDLGVGTEVRRINAQKLIKAGAIVTPGTDNYIGTAPEFRREPKRAWTEPGTGTIAAIEGFVELGMTPSQAIVAGTKNGALACRMEKDLGTVEVGKLADLVLLDADPLADISNIRKVRLVSKKAAPSIRTPCRPNQSGTRRLRHRRRRRHQGARRPP